MPQPRDARLALTLRLSIGNSCLRYKGRWDSNPHNTNASCCAVTVTIWKLPLAVGILTPFKPMKQDD
nr:MAG TPA: hypothetical protein [Caudoviricetes sp.]DAY42449.1 MAG TPA: hypothetical protein [Caudoviricetes sp.]